MPEAFVKILHFALNDKTKYPFVIQRYEESCVRLGLWTMANSVEHLLF